MGMEQEALFGRGQTYTGNFGSAVGGATDGTNVLGVEKDFPDQNWSTRPETKRTNTTVRCRIVRNASGIALLPSRLVQMDRNVYGLHALGYCVLDGFRAFPVDEFLPAGGVLNNDLFWVVIRGMSTMITALDGGADNVITQGLDVTSLTTSSSSQGISAGMIKQFLASGATTPLFNETAHVLGVALTAMTTGQTGALCLVDCCVLK